MSLSSPTAQALLRVLSDTPQHYVDLVDRVGFSESSVRKALWQLRRAGFADVRWRRGWVRR